MNLQMLFQDFNPSKFVVHCCLLIFITLFALRLDEYISWSYWTVFTPIWVWKALVILGATVGSFVWWRYPHFRLEGEAYIHYKSMLISLALHLILLMFELLVCDQLESSRHLWILVFIPLIFISIVSIAVCIWAVKHDRSFEAELFCAVNVLQFIFLALRLDKFILWSWEVVFVPLWIVMCLSLVGVLYTIIFAAILMRTPEVNTQQRRSSFQSAVGYTFLVIPILIFQVLLANKLDEDIHLSYTAVASPLFISFINLILMSFSAKGANKWWFGMRKDFCSFVLGACPLLQEYGNIGYQPERRQNGVELEQQLDKNDSQIKKADMMKPVLPIISIEMPD
ncbi:transmembrane protein 185B [Cylas formicarius]|uniref:transmembrane protein 185B n=1 Tax=Cylas formicarius TaxID=197179 RepID=UPI0029586E9B|nr:transmembrane protein 185B [Cylas formicarius]XP_060533515.1 transmembrane protein 185B [Cylas formicarius]